MKGHQHQGIVIALTASQPPFVHTLPLFSIKYSSGVASRGRISLFASFCGFLSSHSPTPTIPSSLPFVAQSFHCGCFPSSLIICGSPRRLCHAAAGPPTIDLPCGRSRRQDHHQADHCRLSQRSAKARDRSGLHRPLQTHLTCTRILRRGNSCLASSSHSAGDLPRPSPRAAKLAEQAICQCSFSVVTARGAACYCNRRPPHRPANSGYLSLAPARAMISDPIFPIKQSKTEMIFNMSGHNGDVIGR